MRGIDSRGIARRLRNGLLLGLRSCGATEAVANSTWRDKRLLILCYHGVSLHDEHEWDPGLFVTPTFLRRRFEILRRQRCNVLALGEALELLRAGTLPKKSVVLTFDDGFFNFASAAVPLLEEFGFPATVYVSTYHCINQRPLLSLTIRYLVWSARGRELAPGKLLQRPQGVDLRDPAVRALLADDLQTEARQYSGDRALQLKWLGDVAHSLGIDWDRFLTQRLLHLMTPDEIRDVARRGFDVQLHTHRHRTPRDETEFRFEIRENRKILESLTRRPANHFCYPSGDHDPKFLRPLRELGVESATIGVPRLATATDHSLLLPRFIDTMGQPELVFVSWLSGIASWFSPRGARASHEHL